MFIYPRHFLTMLSVAQAIQCQMAGCLEHNELRITWKEAVAANFSKPLKHDQAVLTTVSVLSSLSTNETF
jgi:hypothetical protein